MYLQAARKSGPVKGLMVAQSLEIVRHSRLQRSLLTTHFLLLLCRGALCPHVHMRSPPPCVTLHGWTRR